MEKKGSYHIVYASDDNFAAVLGISILSLLENNQDAEELLVTVLESDISSENRRLMEGIFAEYHRPLPHWVKAVNIEERLEIPVSQDRGSVSQYARLFLSEFFPAAQERVLYLDCDTIVNQSLKELWNLDLQGGTAGVLMDAFSVHYRRNIDLQSRDMMFNSGVMLIDLKRWRERRVEERLTEFIKKRGGRIQQGDQGALNAVLSHEICCFEPRFNSVTIFYDFTYKEMLLYRKPPAFYTQSQVRLAVEEPVIIHFTTSFLSRRPWEEGCSHRYKEVWDRYKAMSPWRTEPDRPFAGSRKRQAAAKIYRFLPVFISVRTAGICQAYGRPFLNRIRQWFRKPGNGDMEKTGKQRTRTVVVMHLVSGLISGGVEQMLYNYCRQMDKEKYAFIVVYQHEPVKVCRDKLEEAGCKTRRITARSESFLKNIFDYFEVIRDCRPDIVHAHMNLMNFCGLLPAFLCGVKGRVSHSHICETKRKIGYRIFAGFCKSLTVLFSNRYLACGREAGEYLYGKRRMKTEVTVVNNAVDLEKFSGKDREAADIRRKLQLEGAPVIGHIGRFSAQKNHRRLLGIFRMVLKRRPEAILLLAGTGELEQDIRRMAEDYRLEKSVIFYGIAKDTSALYRVFDVFVLPSLYEGLPVVAIEAQAAGVNALVSDTVDRSCGVTGYMNFLSLEESDSAWADKIVELMECKEVYDTGVLKAQYDIREKCSELDRLYDDCLTGVHRDKN